MTPATASTPAAAPAAGAAPRTDRIVAGLLLLALVVRVATLGAYPLMDNTEARYAEVARKMVETGDWVTPWFHYGVPFWSKPPLSIWLTSLSFAAFGVSEFTARLPHLLACLFIGWLTWDLARRAWGRAVALRALLVLATTPLFFVSAGGVMTDAALVAGTTLSMVGFWRAANPREAGSRWWGLLFFVGLAIGLLAKGPVGAVLTLAPVGVWTLWKGGIGHVWRRLPWVTGLLLAALITVPWYVLAEQRTPGFLDYFFIGEHWKRYTVPGWKGDMFGTAHRTPRGAIWLLAIASTLPWCAVWAVLALLRRRDRLAVGAASEPATDGFRAYLWLWMLAPAVFFTFAGNILFTYVLPGLPAFALLVGDAWVAVGERTRWRRAIAWHATIVPLGVVAGVLFVIPPLAHVRAHRDLVARVEAMRTSPAQRLVYLREAPHSAEFYARGRTVTVPNPDQLAPYLDDEPRDFFALKERDLADLPAAWRDRLEEVERYGAYRLLREKPADGPR